MHSYKTKSLITTPFVSLNALKNTSPKKQSILGSNPSPFGDGAGFGRSGAWRVLMVVCAGDKVGVRSRGADLVAAYGATTVVVADLIYEKIVREGDGWRRHATMVAQRGARRRERDKSRRVGFVVLRRERRNLTYKRFFYLDRLENEGWSWWTSGLGWVIF